MRTPTTIFIVLWDAPVGPIGGSKNLLVTVQRVEETVAALLLLGPPGLGFDVSVEFVGEPEGLLVTVLRVEATVVVLALE